MPYSQLDVINQTLNLIGRPSVVKASDNDSALLIQNRLLIIVPDLLNQASWNFAVAYRSDDTPLSQNFSPEFTYTYQLPTNFGRFDRFVYVLSQFGFYYRFVDNLLLCNAQPIQYYYIVNDADYSTFTTPFFIALCYYVASKTCLVLTQDEVLTKSLEEDYKYYFDKAVLDNDMQRQIGMTPYNDYDRQVYI